MPLPPLPGLWGLKHAPPPASPTIALDVAAGEGWAQGPAGSGHSVVLSLPSQQTLCQLPDLTQHFLQPTFQSGWGFHSQFSTKTIHGSSWAAHPGARAWAQQLVIMGGGGYPALPNVRNRAGAPESALPLPNHRNIPTHSGSPGFPLQSRRHVMAPIPSLILKLAAGLVPPQIFQSLGNFPPQGQETLTTP